MRNYNYELSMLRSAAIETIRKYIDRNGPQTVEGYSEDRPIINIRNDGPYVVIDEASATLEGTKLICGLASGFEQISARTANAKPAAPRPIPNIRLPYKDDE